MSTRFLQIFCQIKAQFCFYILNIETSQSLELKLTVSSTLIPPAINCKPVLLITNYVLKKLYSQFLICIRGVDIKLDRWCRKDAYSKCFYML